MTLALMAGCSPKMWRMPLPAGPTPATMALAPAPQGGHSRIAGRLTGDAEV